MDYCGCRIQSTCILVNGRGRKIHRSDQNMTRQEVMCYRSRIVREAQSSLILGSRSASLGWEGYGDSVHSVFVEIWNSKNGDQFYWPWPKAYHRNDRNMTRRKVVCYISLTVRKFCSSLILGLRSAGLWFKGTGFGLQCVIEFMESN
jgi:hypothetical protein